MFTPLLKRLRGLVIRPELSFRDRAKLCKNKNNLASANTYPMSSLSEEDMRNYVYDLVRTIIDPEKPYTLEELNIVYENGIEVQKDANTSIFFINVEFTPTIAHCSLATLIGLCIRIKLKKNILAKHKLNIRVKEGTHVTEDAVNKQINDKERVAAAMENPSLSKLVLKCIEEEN